MNIRCTIEDSAHLTGFVPVQERIMRETLLTIGFCLRIVSLNSYEISYRLSSLIVSAYFSRSDGSLSKLRSKGFN